MVGSPRVDAVPAAERLCYVGGVPLPLARSARACVALLLALTACNGPPDEPPDQGGLDLADLDLGALDLATSTDQGVAQLELPALVRLPYVDAGAGAASAEVTLTNGGSRPTSLSVTLSGDALLALDGAVPASLGAGESVRVTLRFSGASDPLVALGALHVTWSEGSADVPVVAVAGTPGLPAATYAPVLAADGTPCGVGTTVALPAAPFPHASAAWTDASVRIFIPDGYRQHADHDMVLHFHGHNTTLAGTLAGHGYEQHLCASGANVLLVVPQGPVDAASGNFGKLMTPTGTAALLEQVLALLYRDARVDFPVRGELTLTSHSGGYQAVAANANAAALRVRQVHLYDSLYGSIAAYTTYATTGGALRSNYTSTGGTLTNNQSFASNLGNNFPSVSLSEEATLPALRDADSVIDFTPSSHNGATRYRNAYGDRVRFGSRRGVAGGRIELRTATAEAGAAQVTFLAPADEDRVGFVVELAEASGPFRAVAEVGPEVRTATFSLTGGAARRVRVRSRLADPAAPTEASDTYALTPDASVLVVDGFERVLGGSYSGRAHDFAARVGVPLGAASVSHRALTEDGFALTGYSAVVWLAGDQSRDDEALSAAEQALLSAYLSGGGALVVSGSEVAYALAGGGFLAQLGASYVADDAGSLQVDAAAALGAAFTGVAFGGPAAPYEEDYPDVLGALSGASVLLRYGTGDPAAVGIAGKAALVGFPLEVVESDAQLATLLGALLGFVQ